MGENGNLLDALAERLADLIMAAISDTDDNASVGDDDASEGGEAPLPAGLAAGDAPPQTQVSCPCCNAVVEADSVLANPVTPVMLATCPQGNPVLCIPETGYAVCRAGNELIVADADADAQAEADSQGS
jgi:hypothetical protein